jgi:hypothetical protein
MITTECQTNPDIYCPYGIKCGHASCRTCFPDLMAYSSYVNGVQQSKEDQLMETAKTQEGGSHYTQGDIQPIEYIQANKLSFCEGNVVKYVTRHRYKNGLEDLQKARQYLDFLMESEYGWVQGVQEEEGVVGEKGCGSCGASEGGGVLSYKEAATLCDRNLPFEEDVAHCRAEQEPAFTYDPREPYVR